MKTNSIMKLSTVLAALLFAGVTGLQAQTNVVNTNVVNNATNSVNSTNAVNFGTNMAQNINFALTLYEQGPTNQTGIVTRSKVNRVRLTTKDIIRSLGLSTSNNFSASAKLVLVQNGSSNGTPSIEVVDHSNVVDVTSSFFFDTGQSDIVVGALVLNNNTGALSGPEYTLLHVDILNPDLTTNLDLSGFAAITLSSPKVKGTQTLAENINSQVAGTGLGTNGANAVVRGTISVAGKVKMP